MQTRDAQTGAMLCRLISSNGFILLITHRANELSIVIGLNVINWYVLSYVDYFISCVGLELICEDR